MINPESRTHQKRKTGSPAAFLLGSESSGFTLYRVHSDPWSRELSEIVVFGTDATDRARKVYNLLFTGVPTDLDLLLLLSFMPAVGQEETLRRIQAYRTGAARGARWAVWESRLREEVRRYWPLPRGCLLGVVGSPAPLLYVASDTFYTPDQVKQWKD